MEGILLPPLVFPQVFDSFEGKDPCQDGFRVIDDVVVILRNPVEMRSVVCLLSSLELNGGCCDDGGDGERVVPGSDCTKELKSVKKKSRIKKN